MGADRSRCRDLRPSCAAISAMKSFRIFDPMLYAPTIDGHGMHHVFCPFTAQVRPQRPEAGGRGIRFDLASHARPGHARGPPTASRSEASIRNGAAPLQWPAPRSMPPKKGDRHVHDTTQEHRNRALQTRERRGRSCLVNCGAGIGAQARSLRAASGGLFAGTKTASVISKPTPVGNSQNRC